MADPNLPRVIQERAQLRRRVAMLEADVVRLRAALQQIHDAAAPHIPAIEYIISVARRALDAEKQP